MSGEESRALPDISGDAEDEVPWFRRVSAIRAGRGPGQGSCFGGGTVVKVSPLALPRGRVSTDAAGRPAQVETASNFYQLPRRTFRVRSAGLGGRTKSNERLPAWANTLRKRPLDGRSCSPARAVEAEHSSRPSHSTFLAVDLGRR